jgi:hypothetical protein
MNRISVFISLILLLSALLFSTFRKDVQILKMWEPLDFVYELDAGDVKNPFDVKLTAQVVRPDGSEYTAAGFYNGNNNMIIRVSANYEGEWSLITHSNVKKLNGHKKKFRCIKNDNPAIHGGLLIDSNNPRHFIFEDGTVPFISGYECDWLWSMDQGNENIRNTEQFLDIISRFGFNYVIMNAYAYDTRWLPGITSEYDYGPPLMIPWEGTNFSPDFSSMNIAYWEHFDKVIDAMHQRGIIAHIMFKVYNKMADWPRPYSEDDDRYFKFIVNRYAAYPNVVWDYAKESYYQKDIDYKKNRLQLIKETDPYNRLVTLHDDDKIFESHYDELIDFHADQFHLDTRHSRSLELREYREWPVMNIEYGYEHGPGGMNDKTHRGPVHSPEENYHRAWQITMAGSYSAYYYTYTAWDVIRYSDTPKGYSYLKVLNSFFKHVDFSHFIPAVLIPEYTQLVNDSEGYCMVKDDFTEFIFYRFKPDPFELKDLKITQGYEAIWLQPYSGEKTKAEGLESNMAAPPTDWFWKDIPIVLYISKLGR